MTEKITRDLMSLADPGYKSFHSRLVPNLEPDAIIGVRVPALRRYASSVAGSEDALAFISALPHRYYEENTLHGLLIECERDFGRLCTQLDRFLPYVDNWATCDIISPPLFKRNPDGLYERALGWAHSAHTYTCRFGVGVLMRCFLDDAFVPEVLKAVADIKSDEYYVNMMRAWFFCDALIKQYDSAVVYLERQRLDIFTHNKSIQKARESNRVSAEQKRYLGTLRIGRGAAPPAQPEGLAKDC